MNNLQKVLYKMLIKVAEFNEELHLSKIIKNKSIHDCLYLLKVYLKSLS